MLRAITTEMMYVLILTVAHGAVFAVAKIRMPGFLKPAILGSLLVARDLALQARARGKDAVVTHLFDGPVALAAAAELALSLPAPALAAGLDPHDRLGDWPAIVVPQLARRGVVRAASAPGLGLDPGGPAWISST